MSHDTPPAPAPSSPEVADEAAAAAPGDRRRGEDLDARQDRLIDEAIEETFPASDPISPQKIT